MPNDSYDIDQTIEFKLPAAAMRFMMLQRADLAYLRADTKLWKIAMHASVITDFAQLLTIDPAPNGILDIGSGIGCVDLLYAKRTGAHVIMVDGDQDTGVMINQDQTFCSEQAVREFFLENDIPLAQFAYMTPTTLVPMPRDFIISLRSWCYHYPPDFYLPFVLKCISSGGAKLVIDIRRDRPEWREQLRSCFTETVVLESRSDRKFDRVAFEHPGVKQWDATP